MLPIWTGMCLLLEVKGQRATFNSAVFHGVKTALIKVIVLTCFDMIKGSLDVQFAVLYAAVPLQRS